MVARLSPFNQNGSLIKDLAHDLHRLLLANQQGEPLLMVADAIHLATDKIVPGRATGQIYERSRSGCMLQRNLLAQARDLALIAWMRVVAHYRKSLSHTILSLSLRSIDKCS